MIFNFFQRARNAFAAIFSRNVTKFNKIAANKAKNNEVPHTYIIPRAQHNVSRNDFSENAIKVLYRLKNSGFDAYLIGGCIRDVLLDIEPKDFDVVTNARPEEIYKLFSNCRIIGRRFPLVHIWFRDEVIEVATFRSEAQLSSDVVKSKFPKFGKNLNENGHSQQGMILRDHVYGNSIQADAIRRDFTVNAIYYNIKDFSLIDFFDGLKDIQNRELKLIGEPRKRYMEDPVRMLRAVRFAAKLAFTINNEASAPILELYHLLSNVPSARLFDEYKKLFLTGYSHRTFILLRKYNLLGMMLPQTESCLKNLEKDAVNLKDTENTYTFFTNFIKEALTNTDERILEAKAISPAFLLAVFLWQPLCIKIKALMADGIPELEAFYEAMELILNEQRKIISFTRITIVMVKDIWGLQLRLKRRQGRKASKTFFAPKFRAAYDFLLLRAKAGDVTATDLALWWTKYIQASDKERWSMAKMAHQESKKKKKKREDVAIDIEKDEKNDEQA